MRVDRKWEGFRFLRKLKTLKGVLKEWNLTVLGDFKRKGKIVERIRVLDRVLRER